MTINKQLIQQKLNLIKEDLEKLSKFKNYSLNDITKDYYLHKAIERIIEVIINEAIDINQHLIVEMGKKDLSFDYRQSFILLGELKILPPKFAKKISASVGLRNILVHQYRKLDEELFYHSIKDCLNDYTKYCRYLQKFIDAL